MNNDTSNCIIDFMAAFGVCRHSFEFLFWADNDIIFITPIPSIYQEILMQIA